LQTSSNIFLEFSLNVKPSMVTCLEVIESCQNFVRWWTARVFDPLHFWNDTRHIVFFEKGFSLVGFTEAPYACTGTYSTVYQTMSMPDWHSRVNGTQPTDSRGLSEGLQLLTWRYYSFWPSSRSGRDIQFRNSATSSWDYPPAQPTTTRI
jgi:hypothetical protein